MADLKNYKVYENENFEVLTDTGFQDFEGIIIGDNPNKIELGFDDGTFLVCTPKHKIILPNGNFKYAKDLIVGDDVFDGSTVNSTISFTNDDTVYELLHVSGGHKYYVNDKLCKQCLIIDEAAYIQPHIMDEFWNSVIPIISSSSNTKIFLISCVAGDTHIFTNKGIKQIKDFAKPDIIGGYEIPEYSILGHGNLRTGRLFKNSGNVKTKKIRTSFNELECSLNHKLWACVDGEFKWVKSEHLNVNDYIAVQYGKNIWGNNDDISSFNFDKTNNACQTNIPKIMNTNLGYFLGLYLSEGYARQDIGGQITITCGDSLIESLQRLGYRVSISKDGLHYSINSKELVDFLKYLGFDITNKAPKKEIPSRVLEMSKPIIASILQGMFDGDGTTHGTTGTVAYISSSEKLIDQLRIILNNFGILSCKYYNRAMPTELVKVESDVWTLEIAGNDSKVFYDEIGFRFKRKQDRSLIVENKLTYNTLDIVPFEQSTFKEIVKSNKIKIKVFDRLGMSITGVLYTKDNPPKLSRYNALKIKNSGVISDKLGSELFENVDEHIRWCKIKEITDGYAEVFDFSLPDIKDDKFDHSIIYNGIVGHQTANGTSNKFYDIYAAAERGESKEWHAERMNWHELPGRGKKWKNNMIESLGSVEAFDQEFGNQFIETGESAIAGSILDRWRKIRKPPIASLDDGHYLIWEPPKENHIYSIGVDVAEGVGEAASCAQVIDVTDLTNIRQVACFHDRLIDPHFFAEKLHKIANQWGRPYLAIERNNAGGQVIDGLYHTFGYNKFINITTAGANKERFGVYSNTGTKYKGVSNMRYWVNTLDCVDVNDIGLIQELETFIRRPNGVWKKKDGRNVYDDRVDAFFWALMCLETEVCQEYFDIVTYDERGKPSKIQNLFVEAPEFYKLDNLYQFNPGAPMPLLFGSEPDDPNNPTVNELIDGGWNFV